MANERRIAELSTRVASNQAAATVDGGDQRRRDEELESARREARRPQRAVVLGAGFWALWLLGRWCRACREERASKENPTCNPIR